MASMKRRSFLQAASTLAAGAGFAQQSAAGIRLFRFEFLYLQMGDQGARLNRFYQSQVPLLTKNIKLLGVFNSLVVPRNPALMIVKGYTGYDQMAAAEQTIRADSGYRKALDELEALSPPYDSAESMLVEPADFSPVYTPLKERPKIGRIFELRYYHSPTERQLGYLRDRFAGKEGEVFRRLGMEPMMMGTMVVGQDTPNWVYMTPFNNLAEREKAWDTFTVDPEWVKARADSIARGGQIVTRQSISLYRAADYSPIQ